LELAAEAEEVVAAWAEESGLVEELPALSALARPSSLWWGKSFRLHSQYLFPIWH